MKQTAIDYLIEELPFKIKNQFFSELKKAKEIEKKEIINAYLTGLICPIYNDVTKQAEQYYIETFKQKP